MMKNIRTTFRNGSVVNTQVDQFNLTSYLAKLDMDLVVSIEYGDVVDNPFTTSKEIEIKPVDIDFRMHGEHFYLDMHTPDNKRVTTAKFTPAKFNDFGLRIMSQTNYEFRAMEQRLEGLDK